jgi:hypothetical protein
LSKAEPDLLEEFLGSASLAPVTGLLDRDAL